MTSSKMTKCSICGQPIKTMFGAIHLKDHAPLVCRRCFGNQSYGGKATWKQVESGHGEAVSEQ